MRRRNDGVSSSARTGKVYSASGASSMTFHGVLRTPACGVRPSQDSQISFEGRVWRGTGQLETSVGVWVYEKEGCGRT